MKFFEENKLLTRVLGSAFIVVVLLSSILAHRIIEGEWRDYTIGLFMVWFGFFVVSVVQFSKSKKEKNSLDSSL